VLLRLVRPVASVSRFALAIMVSVAAVGPGSAVYASTAQSPGAGGGVRQGAAPARSLLLINGDQLTVRPSPAGGQAVAVLPAPGTGGVLSLRTGNQDEVIPASMLPYLGRGLDPSLFDVTALERAEAGERVPVTLTFTGPHPDLPGVTILRWRPGSASGYLTAASARVFNAALQRQYRADRSRASYGSDGLFGGGVTMSLAGAAAPASARPDFPMHTLTVDGTDLASQPDTGDQVIVYNADDWRRFGDPVEAVNTFYHGTAKYSVPAGHYWAIGYFAPSATSVRIVVLPQFTVQHDTTVHIAERSASSEVEAVTPRSAVLLSADFAVERGGTDGTSAGVGEVETGGISLWVSPTATKPAAGTLNSYTSAVLASLPGGPGTPYGYAVDYAGPDGTIPAQRWIVSPASLATVDERYYQDVPATGGWYECGGFPAQLDTGYVCIPWPVPVPGQQIQYLTGNPSVLWTSDYDASLRAYSGGQYETTPALRPGQKLTDNWNQYPLHPQSAVQVLSGTLANLNYHIPSAYRAGNALWLSPVAFSDNQFGHIGAGFSNNMPGVTVTGNYAVYQNGTRIASGSAVNGIPSVSLSSSASTVRFVLNAARHGAFYRLSAASQTAWTWRSVPDPGAAVPAGWVCGDSGPQCAAQPMMTLNYRVAGLGLAGTARSGQQAITLSAGHIEPAKTSKITGARMSVSFDGGQSWRAASVTRTGPQTFRAVFTAPAGALVTLRTKATDATGGSITETITSAYQVAS
jgi:hypothetical protein